MIALDTNIVVRLLTNDAPAQAARARALLARERAFVGVTVVLETEWVLRSAYELPAGRISSGLRTLLDVSTIDVEDRSRVLLALDWHDAGLDFADALHLAGAQLAGGATALATFDRKLEKRAARIAGTPPIVVP